MKAKSFLLMLTIVLSTTSCTTHFFNEPQPVNTKNSKRMPRELAGEWRNDEDKEIHHIDKTTWTKTKFDSLGNITGKEVTSLSDSLIIKRVKRNYFINKLEENGFWVVYLGKKSNKHFLIKGIGKADSLAIKTILKLTPDSIADDHEYYYNNAKIDKKQMLDFVENGGFTDTLFVFDLEKRTID